MGRVARQASINSMLTYLGLVLGFVNMALLYPRYLPTAEFGLLRLIVSIATVAAQVGQLGTEATMIRYFPYFRDRTKGHNGVLGLAALVCTAGALLAIGVLWAFHERFTEWINDGTGLYKAYGLIVLPLVLSEVYFILLRSFSRSVHRSIAPTFSRELLLRLLQALLIAAHAIWDLPFPVFMSLYVTTFFLGTIALLSDLWRAGELRFGRVRLRLPRRLRRSMMWYGSFTMGSGMATMGFASVDQLMIGLLLTDSLNPVAYYAVAHYIATLILVPARALVLPTLPIIADAWRRRDMAQIGRIYHRTVVIQLAIGAYLFLCLWAGSEVLFGLMRPEYAVGRNSMLVLAFANVVNLATGLSGGIVATSRSYRFDAVSGFVLLGLSVALDYVFILQWGMIGAAWSTLVALTVVLGARAIFLHRRHGLWPYDRHTLGAVAVALATAGIIVLLPRIGGPWTDAIVRIGLITVVYWPAMHVLRAVPELEQQFSKILRRFLPSSR